MRIISLYPSDMIYKSLIFILVFVLTQLAFGGEAIFANNQKQVIDLSGNDGIDGTDGRDAEQILCIGSEVRDGLDGEDGANGEPGFDGDNAFVHYDSLDSLKSITLIQNGGLGGRPGIGGEGSFGCNGGATGEKGLTGLHGEHGKYGKIYLIKNGTHIQNVRNSRVVSLVDLFYSPIVIGEHHWIKSLGAKDLFNPKSNIRDEYFLYDYTDQFTIKVKWANQDLISNYTKTRLAVSIKDGDLSIQNYTGAVLNYRVIKEDNTYIIEVLEVTDENQFHSLSFGKMRNSDEKLLVEVVEKYKPRLTIETSFAASIYRVKSNKEDELIGQYQIKPKNVYQVDGVFYLEIGKLNFPAIYKLRGNKLRIHLSIYRKALGQTRIVTLKGLFKI